MPTGQQPVIVQQPYIANARQPLSARNPFIYDGRYPLVYFFQAFGGFVPKLDPNQDPFLVGEF